jgi:hypothetical protein
VGTGRSTAATRELACPNMYARQRRHPTKDSLEYRGLELYGYYILEPQQLNRRT